MQRNIRNRTKVARTDIQTCEPSDRNWCRQCEKRARQIFLKTSIEFLPLKPTDDDQSATSVGGESPALRTVGTAKRNVHWRISERKSKRPSRRDRVGFADVLWHTTSAD